MKILDHCIIYTTDDEEPDCGMCDNQDCEHYCDRCGPAYWWLHYERTERDSKMSRLIIALEKLGSKR